MPAPTAVNYLRHRAPDSALGRLDDVWSFDTHLRVRTLEELDRLSRLTLAVAGVKKSKLPKPLSIPRPGEPVSEPPPSKGWVAALVDASDGDSPGVQVVKVS